ncbi:hypothetical protein [Polaribacter batillariae]|uniref:hypothetical protein n=1 Tax=Polaribacter batillariae TaxID=2808900 RepID=UPI001FB127D4|nr:hypothetical protein [Polaribacter batillariae]
MVGGALQQKGIEINNISSQVDLPFTLLDLVNGNNTDFNFSKNIFNNSNQQYIHYIFNNGFGTFSKNGLFVYDFTSDKTILESGKEASQLDSLGKAISQEAYQDFLDRK